LINTSTQAVFLIDFGLATRLLPTEQQPVGIQGLEGTPAYLISEQAGRVQSPIDMRTGLYSLGVTLYKIFTGRLPFVQADPLELVYAHLAVAPTPPNVLKPDLPQIISNIILKLLAKNQEERYVSAAALAYDLKKCLSASGRQALFETDFIPGEYQKPNYPELTQKIIGRSAEVEQLTGTFEAVRKQGGVRICCLTGPAGIDKTALVYEMPKTLTRYNGIFLSGKFDRLDVSIPYAALIEVFNRLSLQLLSGSDELLVEWKK
jgi:serine/threonine protein kinase